MRRAALQLASLRFVRGISATGSGAGDTIFALSTPPGRAALAVVRASGPGVRAGVLRLLPRGAALPPPRTAALVRLVEDGDPLDRALLLLFPAPRSATGQDVAELHLHGGPAVVAAVLAALARTPGWRPAAAGEFARRAFANGALDLTQAEALADLLAAETAAQRRQALAGADGALGRRAVAWRAAALRCLAHAEAAIDFGEDAALGDGVAAGVAPAAAALRGELAGELARSGWGPPGSHAATSRAELVRSGVRVALGGAPNAGKSSLLNALAGREAAIVSPHAGTTRDALPVGLELGGHKLVVTDTAGLRSAGGDAGARVDEVEVEGMRRARAALSASHVRLLVLDAAALASAPPSEAEWGEALTLEPHQLLVVVLNKADLLSPAQRAAPPHSLLPPWLALRCAAGSAAAGPWLLSCATGEGLDALCAALRTAAETLLGADVQDEPHAVTRARHAAAMRDAVDALDEAVAAASIGGADELAAEELRAAAAALGRLTGIEVGTEDVLDVIFREFCIGK